MKINYHNEDYKANIFNIVVYILVIILFLCPLLYTYITSDKKNSIPIELIIVYGIIILPLIVLLCFSINRYKKRKTQRDLNLFIMKNGVCIKGSIVKIYDNRFETNNSVMHNVTAEVEYQYNNEKKSIVVDDLAINIHKLKEYHNKTVNIYLYSNMSYIDIVND